MESFNWKFFILAVLGTCGLLGIGIGIAEGSALIIIGSILFAAVSISAGFVLKRRNQQHG